MAHVQERGGAGRGGAGRGGGREVTGTNTRNDPAHAHLKNSLRNLYPQRSLSYIYFDGIILNVNDGLQQNKSRRKQNFFGKSSGSFEFLLVIVGICCRGTELG